MMSGIRWSQRLFLVGCVLAMALGVADSAIAGTYVIRNCNVPGERRAVVGPWRATLGAGTFAKDDCAVGGGFGSNMGTLGWGASTGVALETPPGIAVRRIRLWAVLKLRSTGSQLFSVVESGNATTATPVDLFGSPGGSTLASPYVSPLLPADTTIYLIFVSCAGGTGEPCTSVDTDVLDIRGVESTLEENLLPTGSIGGGDLLTVGPQAGVRSLAYTAVDQQSGVARISALIGNTVVGSVDFAADCAYAALAACPQTRNGSIAVDTRKVPDGIYPVSLQVTDAAGNQETEHAASAIQVSNGVAGAPVLPAAGAPSTAANLTASFAASRRATLTAGYGRRVVIRGRLRTPDGAPITGAQINIDARTSSGGQAKGTSVITGDGGVFRFAVRRGPSRTLTLTYSGGSSAVSKRLSLRVKASASLRVALHGVVVSYRGRVLSKPLPRTGKLVEVQGRAPGAAWKTFARRRTSRRGSFSGSYRLRVHRPGVRLQFRVRIPTERGYPFVGHTGAVVTRQVH